MKKTLLALAAMAGLFASCETATPKDDGGSQTPEDAISINVDAEQIIANTGDKIVVTVTSSGEWTLQEPAETPDWITVNPTSGSDGELCIFKVAANETEENRVAEYVFVCGEAKAPLKITSLLTEKPAEVLELVTGKEVSLGYDAGTAEIIVNASVEYRNVSYEISEDAKSWFTHKVTLAGEEDTEAHLRFDYTALEGLDDRTATVTIKGQEASPLTVTLTQYAKHVLSVPNSTYSIGTDGSEPVEIPVTANVKYSVTVTDAWLTSEVQDGKLILTAEAGNNRNTTVTLTQTDAAEGEEPLKAVITITQIDAIVKYAAQMKGNRLFPKWDGTTSPIKNADNATFECLVKFDSFHSQISTIMGIEGEWLVRVGDNGVPQDQIQIATRGGNWNTGYTLKAGKWYHIAVTSSRGYNNYAIHLYVNGVEVTPSRSFTATKYDFAYEWSYEPTGKRCWWYGYSFDSNRDLRGLITEIRMWNKVLTADEINAPNHFYTVDPSADGLATYWRFEPNQKNGVTVIKDLTQYGNDLYGETNVRQQGDLNKGDAGIILVEVALPEK